AHRRSRVGRAAQGPQEAAEPDCYPGPGERFARPGNACRPQQDESWSALPSGHGCRKFLCDGYPYLSAGLDLTDIDAGEAVIKLQVCPPHFDQVRAALPCVGSHRDNSCKLRSGLCLGEMHLLIGPWPVAIVRSCELDPGGDGLA